MPRWTRQHPTDPERFMTRYEAAQAIGVTLQTIGRYIKAQALTPVVTAGRTFVLREQVQAIIAARALLRKHSA